MSKPKVIVLYGPARSGKNTLVDCVVSRAPRCWSYSLSDQIKNISHELVGKVFNPDHKDTPCPELSGLTPRDLYIAVGQLDKFDIAMWPKVSAAKILEDWENRRNTGFGQVEDPGVVAIVESIGKQGQWEALIDVLSPVFDVVLCGISREGAEWNDNRTPITDTATNYHIVNSGDIAGLYEKAKSLVNHVGHIESHFRRDDKVLSPINL